jgi:lantibiotic modifying enzyme
MTRKTWHPILEGEDAEAARATVKAIADDLSRYALASTHDTSVPRDRGGFSFAGGRAGMAIFFAYLDEVEPDAGHGDRAMQLLEEAIEAIGEVPATAGLYSGFSGVAWALEHLSGRLFDPEGEDPGEEVAAALKDHLEQTPWERDYDLISGLAGFGVYALERMPRPLGAEILERTVDRLAETVQEREPGVTWHTPPTMMIPQTAEEFPQGYYNLGMAHGMPAVVGILAEAVASGIAVDRARPLLDGAMAWMLEQKLPPDAASVYPYHHAPEATSQPTRLAWCYGDLGIAASLLATARLVENESWEAEALELARKSARRDPEGTRVNDAGICHGGAGVGHLFNRLYQETGDPELRDAARTWFRWTTDFRKPDTGLAGYLALTPDGDGNLVWEPDPGFLTGVAGIGLCLLAAIAPQEPSWDRVLMASAIGPRK